MRRLLFVCTGNLCRSPVAESIFNALAQERGLEWRAESAGLAAIDGSPVPENVEISLEEVGFYAGGHRARKARGRMVEPVDLVLAMTPQQREKLRVLSGIKAEGKLYTLPEYLGEGENGEVPDPYGYPLQTHRASVRRIYEYMDRLVEHLQKQS
jgi:protein-tyrosine phosphatase